MQWSICAVFSTIAVVDRYDGAAAGSGRSSWGDYDDMEWDRSLELVGGRNQSVRLLRGTCLELADETEQSSTTRLSRPDHAYSGK